MTPIAVSQNFIEMSFKYLYWLKDTEGALAAHDDRTRRFIRHCLKYMSYTKSQSFQDLWVMFELGEKVYVRGQNVPRSTFFVEFGAADGVDCSNTLYLEKEIFQRQRNGLDLPVGALIEPHPIYFKALLDNVKKGIRENVHISQLCIWDHHTVVDFVMTDDPIFSTLEKYQNADHNAAQRQANTRTIKVQAVPLGDYLASINAPCVIDYISMDTEGSEFDILSAFPWENYWVHMWTIEHNYSPNRLKIKELMESKGYKRVFEQFSRWDDWYIRDPSTEWVEEMRFYSPVQYHKMYPSQTITKFTL